MLRLRTALVLTALVSSIDCSSGTQGARGVPAKNRVSPQVREGFVQSTGDVQLFYRLVGSGSDTLVILHGGPGFTMDYFFADLAPLARNHGLLFYDQRGTGRSSLVSDSAGLSGDRFVEDLEAIRRHFGLERLVLLGHSWGSGVVALYALKYPERVAKLIVLGALPLRQQQLTEAFQQLEARRDSSTLRRMRELRAARQADPGDGEVCRAYYGLWFEPFFGDRSAMKRSRGDFCAGTSESRRNKMSSVDRFTFASLGAWDWSESLRGVVAPALILHGTVDPLPLAGARAWAAALPNARLVVLEGVGHFPYLEVSDRFFRTVDEFLRER